MKDLRGAVVVLTGATSGIGRATAHAFAESGARLVLAARSAGSLEAVAAECRKRGGEAVVAPTDITDEEQVERLMDLAVSEFGRIDVCVANASVYAYGTFEQTPSNAFRRVIETNLLGSAATARQVLPHFRAEGKGTLILIGSVYSKITSPYVSAYVASKFGTFGFARVLRQELRDAPAIRVSVVLPATIDTPIYQHAANYTGHDMHPLPPVVRPERVARAIVRNARSPRRVTIVGMTQRTFIPLHAAFPRLYDACVGPLMNTIAVRRGQAARTDGTLYTPAPSTHAVRGGWGKLGRLLRSAPPQLNHEKRNTQ